MPDIDFLNIWEHRDKDIWQAWVTASKNIVIVISSISKYTRIMQDTKSHYFYNKHEANS